MYYVYKEDIELTVSANEETKSAKRYERLVELTLKITGLTHLIRYSEATWDPLRDPEDVCDRWDNLIYTWSRTREIMQCRDLIFSVLHKIKWARYPSPDHPVVGGNLHIGTPYESVMQELLLLVEEELCSAGRGLAVLIDWQWYCKALVFIEEESVSYTTPEITSHSSRHNAFLDARFSALSRPFDIHLGWARTLRSCKELMECVKYILPTASTWTTAEWCNEHYILSQIDQTYQTNYVQTPTGFDELIELILSAKSCSVIPKTVLQSRTNLTFKLLKVLWPHNTVTVIQKLYRNTYRFAASIQRRAVLRGNNNLYPWEFGIDNLKNSGIHSLAVDALANGRIRSKKFKELVFNVTMDY